MIFLKNTQYAFCLLFLLTCCNSHTEKGNADENMAEQVSKVNYDQFFQAALDGNKTVIEQALKAEIDINKLEQGNRTALMLASFNGHTDIVELLISKGATVNIVDENNRTALMFASSGPFASTVETLLKAGANPNVVDNQENWTALMFAAAEGHIENVRLLVEAGADVNLNDTDGETAYDFAMAQHHNGVAKYLKSK